MIYQHRKEKLVNFPLPDRVCSPSKKVKMILISNPTLPSKIYSGNNKFKTECHALYKVKKYIEKYTVSIPEISFLQEVEAVEDIGTIEFNIPDNLDTITINIQAKCEVGNVSNLVSKVFSKESGTLLPNVEIEN